MHAGYRIASSTRRLPYDIANFSYYGLDFYPQHNIEYDRSNYDMASLAWWDLGVTYATYFGDGDYTTWSAGITANYLLGYAATYVTGDQTNYIAYNDSILNVINLDGELGLSLPVNYETDETDYTEDLTRGHGFGFDLGVSWQYNESNGIGHRSGLNPANVQSVYKVKLGLSLLDLGSIRFSKNAEKHVYDQVGNPSINVNELEYDNIRDELNETSRLLYGDPAASLKDDHFTVWLPAALSLQGDYHYRGPWYISGTVVLPVVFASPMVQRTSQFAVAPRYETRNFAINLPLLLNDFRYARWGLSLRIYGLTLGTDRLGAFLGLNDLTGMDAYASLKINIYDRDSRHKNRRNPCDSF
jgi:hypothetical protein